VVLQLFSNKGCRPRPDPKFFALATAATSACHSQFNDSFHKGRSHRAFNHKFISLNHQCAFARNTTGMRPQCPPVAPP